MWKWILTLCTLCAINLHADINVLAFSGSMRKDSVNKKLAQEAAHWARLKGANVNYIDFKDYVFPFYDGDLEASEGMPLKVKLFRQLMIRSQVIFIASPNYNSSLSGMLKNVLDWASRNERGEDSKEAFKGKIFVIMSSSQGSSGGVKGLNHLRSIIEKSGGTVFVQQFVVPFGDQAYDKEGHLKDAKLTELQELITSVFKDVQTEV